MPIFEGEIREVDAGAQGRSREPRWVNHPGADRELGTGRGWKRGGYTVTVTAAVLGMRHRSQGRVAEGGGWRVWVTSSWAALCAGRGGGDWVQTEIGI